MAMPPTKPLHAPPPHAPAATAAAFPAAAARAVVPLAGPAALTYAQVSALSARHAKANLMSTPPCPPAEPHSLPGACLHPAARSRGCYITRCQPSLPALNDSESTCLQQQRRRSQLHLLARCLRLRLVHPLKLAALAVKRPLLQALQLEREAGADLLQGWSRRKVRKATGATLWGHSPQAPSCAPSSAMAVAPPPPPPAPPSALSSTSYLQPRLDHLGLLLLALLFLLLLLQQQSGKAAGQVDRATSTRVGQNPCSNPAPGQSRPAPAVKGVHPEPVALASYNTPEPHAIIPQNPM